MPDDPACHISPPPRAFAQGVGVVFQWIGVTMFLVAFFVCCASALISRDRATVERRSQPAIAIAVPSAVCFGMGLAAVGLGLQAQSRRAAPMGLLLTIVATLFWLMEAIYLGWTRSWWLMLVGAVLTVLFAGLLLLALAAYREMRRNPPPLGHDTLPQDYEIPHSHMHADPPELRLARELEQRRQRLSLQQKELDMLERRLKHKLQQKPP